MSPAELAREEAGSEAAGVYFRNEVASFERSHSKDCLRSKPKINSLAKDFLLRPVHNVYE